MAPVSAAYTRREAPALGEEGQVVPLRFEPSILGLLSLELLGVGFLLAATICHSECEISSTLEL